MSIKIISIILLVSFPGGILIVGLGQLINSMLERFNIKEAIKAIKELGSLVFAEEFSLDGIDVKDRAKVDFDFSG
jgi:hypothetical protein